MAKFKTRARTVDMLGRQQIANVTTAMGELFKNAHDAYADHVEIDYFRSDNLLLIRDDGVGMTPEEFENRWLVLGTESKYAPHDQKADTYRPTCKPERVIMGEKGIGRLAIALLGRQVLILTRAERDRGMHDLVMCFIHWGLFEIPGVNLEDIEIPIKRFPGNHIPTSADVDELLQCMTKRLEEHFKNDQNPSRETMREDISNLRLDPPGLDQFLGGLSLKNRKPGTHFYVAPANEGIAHDIEHQRQADNKDFTKFLLGFSNTVFREVPPPPIKTALRYWPTDAASDDLIGEGEFFTQQDLESADHKISGKFDEYGQFRGDIRIYDKHISEHVISWSEGSGRQTSCGPFEIEFGYVAGAQRESSLPPDEWIRITDKLNKIGGIYVYRDRIRILPYGNSDVDWLNIEERRSKSAAYYFFSYRRVFGSVNLTREKNGLLKEKAGREGFQQDKAYRQLKSILENLLLQLAADFFRDSGAHSEYYNEQRAELEKLELARRYQEKLASTKRKKFVESLENFFKRVSDGQPKSEPANLRESISDQMDAVKKMGDPDEASFALLATEREANLKLWEVRESYRVAKPRGVGLSKSLQRDWSAYITEMDRLEKHYFDPFSTEVAQSVSTVANIAKIYVDQRKRLSELIRQQAESGKRALATEAGQLRKSADDTRSSALKFARDAIREMHETISAVEVDFAKKDLVDRSHDEIERLRETFENRIEAVGRKNRDTLAKAREMLTTISSDIDHGLELSGSDMVEAMDQELLELREQADTDAEMVQLGLAIAVINHEFESAITGVRRSLRELRPWAKSNEGLFSLYRDIRNNFDHLDGHLNLFTPLQRRLYRKPIPIKGSDINHYLHTLFNVRLKRHHVDLKVTEVFLRSTVTSFPSTIYPVFVNIIDNALFWLKDVGKGKQITLDANSDSFLISNNGPPISQRDSAAIFDRGFTRKPGGRGLGLFISRNALRKERMDIDFISHSQHRGVTMIIKWPGNNDNA